MIPLNVGDYLTAHHSPYVLVEADHPTHGTVDITPDLVRARLTADATRTPRYVFSADVANPDLIPRDTSDLLAPGQTVLRVFLGVTAPDGTALDARAATVAVEEFTVARSTTSVLSLTATSAESRVSAAGLWQGETQPNPGETLGEFTNRLLTASAGLTATVDPAVTGHALPDTYAATGDPWEAVEDVCRLFAADPWVDRLGVIRVSPKPALKTTPDATLATGPDGTITAYTSRVERRGAGNRARIVFRSTDPNAPDRVGSAVLTSGPARWDGPLGRLLYTDTRDGPVTQTDADNAAAAALTARVGLVRSVTIQAAPDPRLEPGDTVAVRFVDGSTETHLVTGVDRDLIPGGAMTVTTRGDYVEALP